MKTVLNSFLTLLFLLSCDALNEDKGEADKPPVVTAENFEVTIAENPTANQSLGIIDFTINDATSNHRFEMIQTNDPNNLTNGYIEISDDKGVVSVNPNFLDYFDFEQRTSAIGSAMLIGFNSSDLSDTAIFTITVNLTDVVEASTKSVQERLDDGETPNQIVLSDVALLDSLYGKSYAGGIIFFYHIAEDYGFVAATSDQSDSLHWDFNDFDSLKVTGANHENYRLGALNTSKIIAALGAQDYAANKCNALDLSDYQDWFLPSIQELREMYNRLHANGYGNFKNKKYWSSTELSATSAWVRDFSRTDVQGQTSVTETKTIKHAVRAIREF